MVSLDLYVLLNDSIMINGHILPASVLLIIDSLKICIRLKSFCYIYIYKWIKCLHLMEDWGYKNPTISH